MGLTTIVLAGDSLASHPVFGRNKALLPVQGRALVAHVVRTLVDVPEVERVWIVGPADRLALALADVPVRPGQERHIVPQGRNLYANVWDTFLRTLTDEREPDLRRLERLYADTVIAVAGGDVPLLTAPEMRHFLAGANMDHADYVVGLTAIEALEPYAPQHERFGIRMAALNVAEGGFRQNNLHVVRPFRIANMEYMEEFYEHRYQKEWWNSIQLVLSLATKQRGTVRAITYLARMQAAMRAQQHGRLRLAERMRRGVRMADVCKTISHLLGTRFTTLVCPGAGSALDIDNEHDLVAIASNFTRWRHRLLAEAYAT